MSDAQVETPPVKEAPPEEPIQAGVTFSIPRTVYAFGISPDQAIAMVAEKLPPGLTGASTRVLPDGIDSWKASVSWSEEITIQP